MRAVLIASLTLIAPAHTEPVQSRLMCANVSFLPVAVGGPRRRRRNAPQSTQHFLQMFYCRPNGGQHTRQQ
uniref:Putative secreted protein n=1 Tax=Anopheles darlingi TaxID=43151 RepID=A0A2M4DBB3_ANODA